MVRTSRKIEKIKAYTVRVLHLALTKLLTVPGPKFGNNTKVIARIE